MMSVGMIVGRRPLEIMAPDTVVCMVMATDGNILAHPTFQHGRGSRVSCMLKVAALES